MLRSIFSISTLAAMLVVSSPAWLTIVLPGKVHTSTTSQPPVSLEDNFAFTVRGQNDTADLSRFTPEEQTNIAVYESGNRGVVHITTRSVRADAFFLFETPTEGSGSGSVLDKAGRILTNYHVVEGARESRVTLYNGKSYLASVVGQDADNDIAVLQIEAPAEMLHPIKLGDSSDLRVGQKAYAIGNPFGLERSMTVGIISSLNRHLPSRTNRMMKSIIQLDAALNSGNSGGPLLDSQGEVIGMNTAILNPSRSGENTGIGFAVPVNTVKRVVPQLIQHGRVIRPTTGITRVYETDNGLTVVSVVPGGPADLAGIQGFRVVRERSTRGGFVYERTRLDQSQADLIIAVDNQPVATVDDLLSLIEEKKPGDRVTLSVLRADRPVDVLVTLGNEDEAR